MSAQSAQRFHQNRVDFSPLRERLRMHTVRSIAFLLAAVTSLTANDNGALADTGPCHLLEFERAKYLRG
jgi:hypothetical protein